MKFKKFLFLLITSMFFMPFFVFADGSVMINNGENGYTGTAEFDSDTLTLTLNNYNGKAISFTDFDSEKDVVTIVLKGNNVIDSLVETQDEGVNDAGISSYSIKEFNIIGMNNSRLTINNYSEGIASDNVPINITNATLYFNNIFDEGITVFNDGNLNIIDSTMDFIDSKWAMSTRKGALTIKHSNITVCGGNNMISGDSELNITDGSVISGEKITEDLISSYGDNIINIDGSTLKLKDSSAAILIVYPNDNKTGNVSIKNSSLFAKDVINNSEDLLNGIVSVGSVDAVLFDNVNIEIDNAIQGLSFDTPDVQFKNSIINIMNVYKGIQILNIDGNADAKASFVNSNINIDNSKVDRHLVYGIYLLSRDSSFINTIININNNSSSEYSYPFEFLTDFYAVDDVPYEVAIATGEIMTESLLTFKNSDVNITGKYTADVTNKTPKAGIISLFGVIAVDNSTIHVDVDDSGAAFGSVSIPIDDELVSVSGNVAVTNDGYEYGKYCFDGLCAYGFAKDVNTSVPIEMADEKILIYMLTAMPNKIDIEGILKVKYLANDGTDREVVKNTTGNIKNLPVDIYDNTSKRVFLGWSLTKDGDIISKLETDKDVTLYAIWGDPREYTYEFKVENKEFDFGKFGQDTFTIDGSFMYFDRLEIDDVELIRDVDYTATEGSTIIKFTDAGMKKLNALKPGVHKMVAFYTNGESALYNINIKEEKLPDTGDKIITSVVIGGISLVAIIGTVIFLSKHHS